MFSIYIVAYAIDRMFQPIWPGLGFARLLGVSQVPVCFGVRSGASGLGIRFHSVLAAKTGITRDLFHLWIARNHPHTHSGWTGLSALRPEDHRELRHLQTGTTGCGICARWLAMLNLLPRDQEDPEDL